MAQSWQLNASVGEDLRSLANWEGRVPELGEAPQLVLAAEVMLDAKAGLGNEALPQEPYASWPVIKALYANDIDPISRVSLL